MRGEDVVAVRGIVIPSRASATRSPHSNIGFQNAL